MATEKKYKSLLPHSKLLPSSDSQPDVRLELGTVAPQLRNCAQKGATFLKHLSFPSETSHEGPLHSMGRVPLGQFDLAAWLAWLGRAIASQLLSDPGQQGEPF